MLLSPLQKAAYFKFVPQAKFFSLGLYSLFLIIFEFSSLGWFLSSRPPPGGQISFSLLIIDYTYNFLIWPPPPNLNEHWWIKLTRHNNRMVYGRRCFFLLTPVVKRVPVCKTAHITRIWAKFNTWGAQCAQKTYLLRMHLFYMYEDINLYSWPYKNTLEFVKINAKIWRLEGPLCKHYRPHF